MIGPVRNVYPGGVAGGRDLFDRRVSLHEYRELFNHFAGVTFPVSTLSPDAGAELVAYSWIFPNVVPNGHWWYSNLPAFIAPDLKARLQGVPKVKQIGYYSDAYKLEFVLPKFNMYRKILAEVLADDAIRKPGLERGLGLGTGAPGLVGEPTADLRRMKSMPSTIEPPRRRGRQGRRGRRENGSSRGSSRIRRPEEFSCLHSLLNWRAWRPRRLGGPILFAFSNVRLNGKIGPISVAFGLSAEIGRAKRRGQSGRYHSRSVLLGSRDGTPTVFAGRRAMRRLFSMVVASSGGGRRSGRGGPGGELAGYPCSPSGRTTSARSPGGGSSGTRSC